MRFPVLTALILLLPSSRVAYSQATQTADPFAGDARLQIKQTIRASAVSFRELLADLTDRTKIQFRAGKDIAEDKIVLYAFDRPLEQSLRVVARHFNFMWDREGKPGEYVYTLTQSQRQKREEEKELEERLWQTAEQIHKEIPLCLKLAENSEDDNKARREEVQRLLLGTKDEDKRKELQTELMILANLEHGGSGTAVVVKMLRSATVEDLVGLMRAGATELAWPEAPGKRPLPAEALDEIKRIVLAQNVKYNNPIREFSFASLKFDTASVIAPALSGTIEAGVISDGGRNSSGPGFRLPVDQFFDTNWQALAVGPLDWDKNETLTRLVTCKVDPIPFPWSFPQTRSPLFPPLIARVLTDMQESLQFDVISDAFYADTSDQFTVRDVPLGKALSDVCGLTNHRWEYKDGFVILRSRRYAADRVAEPATTSLKRWAAMNEDELFTLDHLSEIAAQPYPRFETTVRVLRRIGALGRGMQLGAMRGHLMFWNALTPIQRASASSKKGLAYRYLRPEIRAMFELASLDKLTPEGIRSSNQDRSWPPEELAGAVFTVEFDRREMWGYRTANGMSTAGGTREAVFESLSKQYPGITLDMLKPCRSRMAIFRYSGAGGFRIESFLNLPLYWMEEAKPRE